MADPRLVSYIKQYLAKGYTINTIKDYLVKYGYSRDMVEEAASLVYKPYEVKHVVHLHPTTLLALLLIIVLIGAGIFSIFWFVNKEPATLLDVKIKSSAASVKGGEDLTFNYELSNLGSARRYDVALTHSLIRLKDNKEVAVKTETIALETKASHETEVLVPADAEAGSYILRTVAKYNGKAAVSSLSVKVTPAEKRIIEEIPPTMPISCKDGIQNNGEEGIDCGGPCEPCEEKREDCDDGNACTKDSFVGGECIYEPIVPCCGNKQCENGEDYGICPADCPRPVQPVTEPELEGLSLFDRADKIKEIAAYDPDRAFRLCRQMEDSLFKDRCIANVANIANRESECGTIRDERTKDECYATIAKNTKNSKTCERIINDPRRDSCYMSFVTQGDYSMCDKIFNQYLKQSCESLRSLSVQQT